MTQPARLLGILLCAACATALPSQVSAQAISAQPVTTSQTSDQTWTPTSVTPSGKGLFSQILTEFGNLPSSTNLMILGVGGIGAGLGHVYDTRISNGLTVPSGSGGATGFGNAVGSMQVQFATAFATYSLGKVSHNAKITAIGSDLVRAQIVTQTLTQGIKFATGRTRPDGTSYSFPSGHTSTTFATATVLQRHLGWKAGIPAYGLATLVAASRVESKRHFLSDVAFGAAVGVVGGRTVTIGRGDARFAVSPAAAPGGGGVNFTWVGKK